MNENRIVFADFCDDIRQEVGYKFSLMGCYSGEVIVDTIPVMLPKLCASITAITPLDQPFINLTFRAYLNEDIIAESIIPTSNLEENYERLKKNSAEYTKIMIKVQMAFIPLIIQEQSVLRIEAETEDGIIKGPKLKIRQRVESDPIIIQQ